VRGGIRKKYLIFCDSSPGHEKIGTEIVLVQKQI